MNHDIGWKQANSQREQPISASEKILGTFAYVLVIGLVFAILGVIQGSV